MSVYLYKHEFTNEMPPMESSDALILGIIAGIIGALVTTFLSALISLILGPVETEMMRNFMEKLTQKLEDRGSIPQGTLDNMRGQFEQAVKEGGTVGGILRSLVYALILYPIFSMLGGLIGYGIFGRKKPAVPPQPPMQQ
jgi:ABC-type antimicrobial peptide transport system permease subunit